MDLVSQDSFWEGNNTQTTVPLGRHPEIYAGVMESRKMELK